jgi:hypothetical protein
MCEYIAFLLENWEYFLKDLMGFLELAHSTNENPKYPLASSFFESQAKFSRKVDGLVCDRFSSPEPPGERECVSLPS